MLPDTMEKDMTGNFTKSVFTIASRTKKVWWIKNHFNK